MATWEHCAGCLQMAAVGSALQYVLLLPRAVTLKSCSGCGPTCAGLGGTETRARPRPEAATWRSCNIYWHMGVPGTGLASAEPLRQPAISSSCSGWTRSTASDPLTQHHRSHARRMSRRCYYQPHVARSPLYLSIYHLFFMHQGPRAKTCSMGTLSKRLSRKRSS